MSRKKHFTKKTCPRCGNAFETSRGNQVYCSMDCQIAEKRARARASASEQRKPKFCEICGQEITGNGRKYCSPDCAKDGWRDHINDYNQRQREEQKRSLQQALDAVHQEQKAKESRKIVARNRKADNEQAEGLRVNYMGCTAGYNLEELRAIGKENNLSYGKLTTMIACNTNEIPEGIHVPDLTKLIVKGERWKRRPIF